MGATMLALTDLVAGYGTTPIARLGGLALEPGAAALLLGPSGAGKTTLLLAVAGLADALSGRIVIDGVDVTRMPPRARDRHRGRTIGIVFQDLQLTAGLTTLENLLLAPYASGAPQDAGRARALLGDLGLSTHLGQRAERLSRGQAQRAAIARAMLLGPRLILADEPTASLDDATAETVADLLLRAAAETGAALLIATHDARLKARIATHFTVDAAR